MAVVRNTTVLRRLRYGNVERVLAVLRQQGPSSRAAVAAATGLSRTTLSGIVGQLLADGVLTEEPAPAPDSPAGRGRPVRHLALNPRSARAVGIEIGRERVRVVLANAAHEVTASAGVHHSGRGTAREQALAALGLLRERAGREGIDLAGLAGVGIGTPGPGETDGGASATGQDAAVPRHRGTVADTVAEALDVPVLADNNSRLAALGEAIWGAARGASDVLYLTLSHGVGGGLVTSGRLFRGAQGAAGELGHVHVDPDGPGCWCGGHGCLEQTASVPALLRATGRRSLSGLHTALAAGGEAERAAVEHAARAVGRVLAAAASTVNPRRVVLGGEVAELGEVFLAPVTAAFQHFAPTRVHQGVQLVPAALADRAGALGALALVFHESPLLAGYAPTTGVPAADDRPADNPTADDPVADLVADHPRAGVGRDGAATTAS